MPIHLYQSKKVKRYIGDREYMDMPWAVEQVDPLTLWYCDVFFIKRARYIVVTNPLTKFTFFIFRYSRTTHPDFMQAFREKIAETLRSIDIDPASYLMQCDVLVPFEQTNKSASAHLSRMKREYEYIISTATTEIVPPDDETYFNALAARDLTSYDGKGYDYPAKRFYHELLLRRWV